MSRRSALAALAGAATAGAGVAVWKLAVPAIARAGTGKPAASKLAVRPGTPLWHFKANDGVESVAAAGNLVYTGTGGNTVYAIDAATGRQRWRSDVNSEHNSPMAAASESVIINGDNAMFALAADNGRELWHIDMISSALAAAGQVVYAGIEPKSPANGGVTALNAATGELLWIYPFGRVDRVDIAGPLVVADGSVYTTTSNGEIFVISADEGGTRRRITGFPGAYYGPGGLAVADGVIYVGYGIDNIAVAAVSAATGKTRWQRDLGSLAATPQLAAWNGILFVGLVPDADSDASGLYALDAATGKTRWSMPVPGGLEVSMLAAGDTVYAPSQSGVLDARQASTGKGLWSYRVPHDIGGGVALGSGLYFGAGDYVYAVAR